MRVLKLQAWLKANNYDPGPVDGILGSKTRAALEKAGGKSWLASSHRGLTMIVMHWDAGAGSLTPEAQRAYHTVTTRDKETHLCNKPEINIDISDGNYCAHARNFNDHAIGMAIAGMVGTTEKEPFNRKTSFTTPQLKAYVEEVADMADTYGIPITPWSVMTHAEIQARFGVRQRNKWDIRWLPDYDNKVESALHVGNELREMIRKAAV